MIALVKNALEKEAQNFATQVELAGAAVKANNTIAAADRPRSLDAAEELLHSFLKERSSRPYAEIAQTMKKFKGPLALQTTSGLDMMCGALGKKTPYGIILPVAQLVETIKSSPDLEINNLLEKRTSSLIVQAASDGLEEIMSRNEKNKEFKELKMNALRKMSERSKLSEVEIQQEVLRMCITKEGQFHLSQNVVSIVGAPKDISLPMQRAVSQGH